MWAEGKLGAVYKGVGAPIAALCVLFAINFGFVWFFFVFFFENSEFDFSIGGLKKLMICYFIWFCIVFMFFNFNFHCFLV